MHSSYIKLWQLPILIFLFRCYFIGINGEFRVPLKSRPWSPLKSVSQTQLRSNQHYNLRVIGLLYFRTEKLHATT